MFYFVCINLVWLIDCRIKKVINCWKSGIKVCILMCHWSILFLFLFSRHRIHSRAMFIEVIFANKEVQLCSFLVFSYLIVLDFSLIFLLWSLSSCTVLELRKKKRRGFLGPRDTFVISRMRGFFCVLSFQLLNFLVSSSNNLALSSQSKFLCHLLTMNNLGGNLCFLFTILDAIIWFIKDIFAPALLLVFWFVTDG